MSEGSKKSDQAAGTLDIDAIEQRARQMYSFWAAEHAVDWYRSDVPALCAEVRRLRALCEQGTSVSAPETHDDASCG